MSILNHLLRGCPGFWFFPLVGFCLCLLHACLFFPSPHFFFCSYGRMYQGFQKLVMVYETEPDNFPRLMELMQDVSTYKVFVNPLFFLAPHCPLVSLHFLVPSLFSHYLPPSDSLICSCKSVGNHHQKSSKSWLLALN